MTGWSGPVTDLTFSRTGPSSFERNPPASMATFLNAIVGVPTSLMFLSVIVHSEEEVGLDAGQHGVDRCLDQPVGLIFAFSDMPKSEPTSPPEMSAIVSVEVGRLVGSRDVQVDEERAGEERLRAPASCTSMSRKASCAFIVAGMSKRAPRPNSGAAWPSCHCRGCR